MKKFNNRKVIFISISIVSIILFLIILYIAIEHIKSLKLEAFRNDLIIMQTQIDKLYDNVENTENIGKKVNNNSQAYEAFKACNIKADINEYRFFDTETLNKLNIQGVTGEFLVNLNTRSIISYKGLEYKGKKYYTLRQLPDN